MNFTRRSNTIYEVQEILEIIDVGVTVPIRCRFDDGTVAIVKYMKNRSGIRTLINEWIGSSIADCIGLSIPNYGLCDLSEDVITKSSSWNEEDELTSENAGLAFYSQNISKAVCPDPFLLSRVVNRETELVILHDLLINNQDRHIGNVLVEMCSEPYLYFIDNSHCLESHLDLKKFLSRNNEIYDLLALTVGFNAKKLSSEAERIQNALTPSVLETIRATIPLAWSKKVSTVEINQIFKGIQDRLSNLERLSRDIAAFRRNRDE